MDIYLFFGFNQPNPTQKINIHVFFPQPRLLPLQSHPRHRSFLESEANAERKQKIALEREY